MSTTATSHRPAPAVVSRGAIAALALPAILLLALAIRLYSVTFGLPALNDPDELTFELGAIKMLSGPTLNPGWFGHPATTTMYVLAVLTIAVFGLGHLLGRFPTIESFADAIYADPSWVLLPGRVAMAVFAVATIYLVYRLARELFDRNTALAAAALLTVNPVHVTWSQIIRSDMMACFFMLLGMLAALRILRENRWRDYVLAAVWLGAAMATKWPYALTALAVIGAVVARGAAHPAERSQGLVRLALCGSLALVFLFLISPYLLLDHQTALRNMHGEAQVRHLGATGGAPWENAWWYLAGPLATGLGWLGLGFVAAGLAIIARRREAAFVVLPVVLGFAMVLCVQNLVWERWVLSLMPLLAIAAAVAFMSLARRICAFPQPFARVAMAMVALAILVPLALRTESDARARLNDTRQRASRWAEAHVAPGSTILLEHFAFDLLPRPWHFLFPFGSVGCIDARATLGGKIQLSTVQSGRGSRTNIDYGTVAADKRGSCAADYAILTQADRYAAESQAFPEEAAAYRTLMARGTLVASFVPEAGKVGGPVVRIVKFSR
ncbi:ArnT family glycosyltransferase [Novosphingobium sp. JCM 18896]|uniref:ArnT family glycosyltransferase n=1 Tax=Novosphingobium sp. JCM 18896 TaxID=2989731 RepID=UPI0022225452|nr:glycosyltransferase family 39 protein [Novosphingobium sp. JCM 18896]MCW1429328.1 glycosyltransferase family 39 protein [Novosphingobium sp. JCM 18896]